MTSYLTTDTSPNTKAPNAHTHPASAIVSGVISMARLATGTPDGTKFIRDDGTLQVPGGGSGDVVGDDVSTTAQNIVAYSGTGGKNITELTGTQGDVLYHSDFSTTSNANQSVTGLSFAPSASTTYLVEVYLLLRTATATVGARPGFSWPTGMTDGGGWMQAPNSATAYAMRTWGTLNTQNAASTGLPTTTTSHLALGGALIVAGGSPSGNLQVTLASETNGTSVTVKAGSMLRYRSY